MFGLFENSNKSFVGIVTSYKALTFLVVKHISNRMISGKLNYIIKDIYEKYKYVNNVFYPFNDV